jgi:hypothetical protein
VIIWEGPVACAIVRRGAGAGVAGPCTKRTPGHNRLRATHSFHQTEDIAMSKGMDQKKTEKKKPEKTLKEKRAAKKEKKAGK